MIKSLFLSSSEIIKYPIVTDKATRLLENNNIALLLILNQINLQLN